MSILPPDSPAIPPAPSKRGRKPAPDLSTFESKLDRILAILDGATEGDRDPPALLRIAVALEKLAGGVPVLTATPPEVVTAPIPAPPAGPVEPVKVPPPPAPVAPALSTETAPVEDIRSTAVAFVEKWGRDVLVNILAKFSKTGKLSDLSDVTGFLVALRDYDAKASGKV